ncbi:MAG: hypothetical protein DWQ31_17630 [Planctomycetota bacterium]|nr:MAG: hypothetical protein DWQ31_17630 [Planctomycetota bacterium]REJ92171.1 MAG: hypothetical protein DWQ35_13580 [Planctomycetota bacterium]
MKRTILFGTIVLAVVSLAIYGCGSPSNNAEQTPSPPANGQGTGSENGHGDHGDHGGHDEHGEHGDHSEHGQTDMEKMKAELAKLSPEDATSAEKQHFCPVSGEMLGTMGAPKKIDVNGQQVWICCGGCKDKLLANPDEYLAKLKKE